MFGRKNNPEKPSLFKKTAAVALIGAAGLGLAGCGEKAGAQGNPTSESKPSTSSSEVYQTPTPETTTLSPTIEITDPTSASTPESSTPSTSVSESAPQPTNNLDELDVKSLDFIEFTPVDLDGSSPESLLKTYEYNMNCVANELREEVVKECIEKITGSDATSADNIQALMAYASGKTEYRTVFSSFKEKKEYTLVSSSLVGGITTLEARVLTEDSTGSTQDTIETLTFSEKDGVIHLDPSTVITVDQSV